MQFSGESPPHRAKQFESFAQAFSKACADPTRVRWSPSADGETPYRSKRHGRVNAKLLAWQRGTTQVGGSPFSAKAILIVYPLFLLMQEAQKKKLSKKKMPQERFRRVRAATNATRVGSAPPFREKVDENNSGFAVANSSPNQNLKCRLNS